MNALHPIELFIVGCPFSQATPDYLESIVDWSSLPRRIDAVEPSRVEDDDRTADAPDDAEETSRRAVNGIH